MATRIRQRAYAPYSNFLVGAAVLTTGGKIYAGCNVECADYDGTHAEESALSAMVAAGERSPSRLLVLAGLRDRVEPTFVTPCGKCRQKLMEFFPLSGCDLRIFTNDMNKPHIVLLSDLLPRSFGPADIGVDLAKHRR
ncbi:MAG: cytidine deaminase [Candidatus Uhrbacteria bacterium]|nr:cytidine deaminase [Candidatus Uhrbacteria bacterium]